MLGLQPDTLEPDCVFSSSKVLILMMMTMMMIVMNMMIMMLNVSDQACVRHHPLEQRGEREGSKGSEGAPLWHPGLA